jgi:hypothetical protein
MPLEGYKLKEKYLLEVKAEWLSASEQFPDFLQEISDEIKEKNSEYIQALTTNLQNHIKGFSRLPFKKKKWKQRMLFLINDFLYNESIIGIHESLDNAALNAFYNELMDFLRQERSFSPELRLDEIGQATRNYIVYAMFKVIHRDETGFYMPGFAYSMLYPFTDNYIDNRSNLPDEKSEYNQIIRDRLEGREVHPRTVHQKKTCELLSAIANEYPRSNDSTVYKLLLMMLEAQELSLQQQNKNDILSEEERLNISLYKGGISVLVDRYLVKKPLTEEEIILYLGLGFFLQLADDLQDIREDINYGSQTLLTLNIKPESEERIVNKLLHFVHNTLGSFRAENDVFKNFVLANCYQLIYTSVIGSREFFSEEYLYKIEKLLPVKSAFAQELKKGLYMPIERKLNKKYLKILDVVISD